MKLLHTADWHIGRVQRVFGEEVWDRLPDQRIALQRLADLVDKLDPQVIVIAGDLYDVARPRTEAEQLVAEYLPRLSGQGKRIIVVVAGNHDSRTGLTTYRSWALPHGIILLGTANDTDFYRGKGLGQGHKIDSPAPGVLNIHLAEGSELLQIYAFPHLYSSQWVGAYKDEQGNTYDYEQAWSRVPENHRKEGAYQVFVGHSFCVSGKKVGSFLELPDDETGKIFQVGPEDESRKTFHIGPDQPHGPGLFHEAIQYIALGHLHRPHQVGSRPIYYPGSLLWYGPQHSNAPRQVYLATWSDPMTPPRVEPHILDLSEFKYEILETDNIEGVSAFLKGEASPRKPLWLKWKGSELLPIDILQKLSKTYYLFYQPEIHSINSSKDNTSPNEALRILIKSGDEKEILREFLKYVRFPDEDIEKSINIIFTNYADIAGEDSD